MKILWVAARIGVVGWVLVALLGLEVPFASAHPMFTLTTPDHAIAAATGSWTVCGHTSTPGDNSGVHCTHNIGDLYVQDDEYVSGVGVDFSDNHCFWADHWQFDSTPTWANFTNGNGNNLIITFVAIGCDDGESVTLLTSLNASAFLSAVNGTTSHTMGLAHLRGYAIDLGCNTCSASLGWSSVSFTVVAPTSTPTNSPTVTLTPTFPPSGGGYPWYCPAGQPEFGHDYNREVLRQCGCIYVATPGTPTPPMTTTPRATITQAWLLATSTCVPGGCPGAVPTVTLVPTLTPGPSSTPTLCAQSSYATAACGQTGATSTPVSAVSCSGLVATQVPTLIGVDPGGLISTTATCYQILDAEGWNSFVEPVSDVVPQLVDLVPNVEFCFYYYSVPRLAVLGYAIPLDVILSVVAMVAIVRLVNRV